jgi:serine/threonine-protein kinase
MSEDSSADTLLYGVANTQVDQQDRVSLGKTSDEPLAMGPLEPRYSDIQVLGEGGMGEVRLVRDLVIGRDIALKRIRAGLEEGHTRERFLREARVQGQLEHPSIVPVYDVAMTPDRRLFFTMRRVRGRTLDAYARGKATMTRHAMLNAMSRVCLAVDFAHRHGIIHRDIKLANIMLGDYGEVYVLDWGLARLGGMRDDEEGAAPATERVSYPESQQPTVMGSVMGTPGYMPPEQARGEELDPRADIYSLGACLFHLLAGEPLVDIGPPPAMLAATVLGVNARVSERAPDREVPVELEAICVRATMFERAERFPSARAMSEAIEAFLEGDRDLERRRERAREHAIAAQGLAAAARSGKADETRSRKDAMRELGRALANDPDNEAARRVLVELLTEPLRAIPPDLASEMQADRERSIQSARRVIALGLGSTLVPLAIAACAGVRDLPLFGVGVFGALAGMLVSLVRGRVARDRRAILFVVALLILLPVAQIASPLVVLPLMAMGFATALTLFPRSTPWVAGVIAALVCILLPFVLEWTGVLASTLHIEGDHIIIDAALVRFGTVPTLVWFFVATLTPIAATCIYLAHVRDRLLAAERQTRMQAWQLRQMVQ